MAVRACTFSTSRKSPCGRQPLWSSHPAAKPVYIFLFCDTWRTARGKSLISLRPRSELLRDINLGGDGPPDAALVLEKRGQRIGFGGHIGDGTGGSLGCQEHRGQFTV